MRRWSSWRRASLLLVAFALAAVPRAGLATGAAPVERLVLEPVVGGAVAGEPVVVVRSGTNLWLSGSDARALGLTVPADVERVALAVVPHLRARIDDGRQQLILERPADGVQQLALHDGTASDRAAVTPNGWGGAFNYDVSVARAPGSATAGGVVEAVIYAPRGYGFAGAVASVGDRRGAGRVTRLDIGYVIADSVRATRATIGDYVGNQAGFARPIRMAGAQIGTDFALRPDLVTTPLPALDGQAAVPSVVDLVVNGARRARMDVRAGQFQVADIPVQSGVNTITVAVRDALGRVTQQTVSTYSSRALLRPGLSSYSIEAGLVRTGYGGDDDRYRQPAAAGHWRRGVTGRLTLEAQGQVGDRVTVAGIGGALALGRFGLVEVAAAATRQGARQWSASFERIAHPISVSARYIHNDLKWFDLAARYGSVTRSRTGLVSVGIDMGRAGTLSGSLVDLGRGRVARPLAGAATDEVDRSRFVTASYSARLTQRLNLIANGGGDLRRRGSAYASIGLLAVFGGQASAFAGAVARRDGVGGSADYARRAVLPGDWGYRATAAVGGVDRLAAGVEHQARFGRYEAMVERTEGHSAVRGSASGALILAGGAVYAADRVASSFALVDTGQPGLTIFRDNRRVGRTDARGHLIVANLRPYEAARLSIDPTEVPDDVFVAATELVVRPAERAGVVARFPLRRQASARIRLVDDAGLALPAGSRVTLNGAGDLPVGFEGEVFAAPLLSANTLDVRLAGGGRCAARVTRPAAPSLAAVIGPIRCVSVTLASR